MFKKKTLILALATMLSLPAFASVGETEHSENDDYGMEHSELDNDLHTNLGMAAVAHDANDARHVEVEDANGNVYSYSLQPGSTGTCTGQTVCYRDTGDGTGSVEVTYNTGRSETAHPESHNQNELNEHAGQLGYTIVSKTNGIMTVRQNSTGNEIMVRYSAQLARGVAGVNPGLRVENGRIVERYTDGWEQEILPTTL